MPTNTTNTTQRKPQGVLRWSQREAVGHIQAAYQDITVYSVPVTLVPGATLDKDTVDRISHAFWVRESGKKRQGSIIGSSYGNVSHNVVGPDYQRPGNILIHSSFYIGD